MKRSKHNLSHYRLLTVDGGFLYPCSLMEALPGDTIQQATSVLLRAQPMLSPPMHPMQIRLHHWFVPNRLIWDDWENFITGGPDGNDASVYPTVDFNPAIGSLADYMGVPTGTTLEHSALPYRAYALIWNEFYRDQDLQTELTISKASGADTTTSTALQRAAWEKDYFTSARPWEQKGDSIFFPIGSEAPVASDATTSDNLSAYHTGASEYRLLDANLANLRLSNTGGQEANRLYADLSQATGISVNEFREIMALQRFKEARARFGSRYTEYLRYLNVRSSDARLQRPEYLGGGKATVQFSEVLQTAVDNTTPPNDTPVGTLRGHGIGSLRTRRYRRFIEEHGWIISLVQVRPRTMYLNGVPRHWLRQTKEDFWQKELQHIGQQEVWNAEVYNGAAAPRGTFGYQDRYDEYRSQWSGISGEFRDTLDFWHFARDFASEPALNEEFIECNPTDRPFAVQSTNEFLLMARHSVQARRLVARRGESFIR